jgi:3-dehydroquinate dehydratase
MAKMFVLLVALGVNHARQLPAIVWLASSPSTIIILIPKSVTHQKIAPRDFTRMAKIFVLLVALGVSHARQ